MSFEKQDFTGKPSILEEPGCSFKNVQLVVDEPVLHKFNLEEIGVDRQDLLCFQHTFDELPSDEYERKLRQIEFLKARFPDESARLNPLLGAYYLSGSALDAVHDLLAHLSAEELRTFKEMPVRRRRTIAKFEATCAPDGSIEIERVESGVFIQMYPPSDHPLSLPRHFCECSEELTESHGFKLLLQSVCAEIFSHSPAKSLTLIVHQVTMIATKETPFVLPDGIHQDGADYIVSAIPIVLEDVNAPTSTVYDLDKQPLLQTKLQVGEGLLHDDRLYWHSVSDLHATGAIGRRGTFGFDIRVTK